MNLRLFKHTHLSIQLHRVPAGPEQEETRYSRAMAAREALAERDRHTELFLTQTVRPM